MSNAYDEETFDGAAFEGLLDDTLDTDYLSFLDESETMYMCDTTVFSSEPTFDHAPSTQHKHPMEPRKVSYDNITMMDTEPEVQPKKRRRISRVTLEASDSEAASIANQLRPSYVPQDEQLMMKIKTGLQNLAACMERTQLSRRQVAMQRNIPLENEEQDHQSVTSDSISSPSPTHEDVLFDTAPLADSKDEEPSLYESFFSGTRNTLTVELEQSRKQLQMYMNQVGSQTTMCW